MSLEFCEFNLRLFLISKTYCIKAVFLLWFSVACLIFIFYLLSLQLVLCRVAALKAAPYIVHSAVYILLLVL